MCVFQIVQLTTNQEVVIPVCNFNVKHVALSVVISLKNREKPTLTYISTEHNSFTVQAQIEQDTFLDFYTRAYQNTHSSPHYLIHGYYVATNVSALHVYSIVSSQVWRMQSTCAIQFIKSLIRDGFDIHDMHTLLEQLIHREMHERLLNKSASLIQCRFREEISNPYRALCKKRLEREFSEMQF